MKTPFLCQIFKGWKNISTLSLVLSQWPKKRPLLFVLWELEFLVGRSRRYLRVARKHARELCRSFTATLLKGSEGFFELLFEGRNLSVRQMYYYYRGPETSSRYLDIQDCESRRLWVLFSGRLCESAWKWKQPVGSQSSEFEIDRKAFDFYHSVSPTLFATKVHECICEAFWVLKDTVLRIRN